MSDNDYAASERERAKADWAKRKRDAGRRGWNALYQGDPPPDVDRDCGDASDNAMCTRPAGHPGAHYDATIGLTWTADDPPAGLLPRVDELTARLGTAFKAAALCIALESVQARVVELRDELAGKGRSAELDAVDAALKCVGLGFDTRVNDIGDLAGQRDSHAEHAKNCEDALARIADMARKALGTTGDYRFALTGVLAITQENDR